MITETQFRAIKDDVYDSLEAEDAEDDDWKDGWDAGALFVLEELEQYIKTNKEGK